MVGIGLPGCRAPLPSRIQLDGASDCLSNESCRCGIACKNLDSPCCKRCAAVRAAATIEVKVLAPSVWLGWIAGGRPGFAGSNGVTLSSRALLDVAGYGETRVPRSPLQRQEERLNSRTALCEVQR